MEPCHGCQPSGKTNAKDKGALTPAPYFGNKSLHFLIAPLSLGTRFFELLVEANVNCSFY